MAELRVSAKRRDVVLQMIDENMHHLITYFPNGAPPAWTPAGPLQDHPVDENKTETFKQMETHLKNKT